MRTLTREPCRAHSGTDSPATPVQAATGHHGGLRARDAVAAAASRRLTQLPTALVHAHSIARNQALIDGNKRLALAAVIAFYGLNGRRLTLTNDAACDLVISVASGQLNTVDAIAAVLQTATEPR